MLPQHLTWWEDQAAYTDPRLGTFGVPCGPQTQTAGPCQRETLCCSRMLEKQLFS